MTGEHGPIEAAQLRRELSIARGWAWAAHHRLWDYRWFPSAWRPGDGEWNLPTWLDSSVAPDQQSWFIEPDAPVDGEHIPVDADGEHRPAVGGAT